MALHLQPKQFGTVGFDTASVGGGGASRAQSNQGLMELFCARQRRKFSSGFKWNTVIIPEMIGCVVGVYNGEQYINVEVSPLSTRTRRRRRRRRRRSPR